MVRYPRRHCATAGLFGVAKTVLTVIGVENVNMVARLMRGNRMVIAVGSHDDEHVGCVGLGEHVCQGLHCLIFVTHHIDDDIRPKPHPVVLERRRKPLAVWPALAANRQFMLTVALLLRANALKRLDLRVTGIAGIPLNPASS